MVETTEQDARVEISDAVDYFPMSCEETYGTFRGVDEEGFGLDLGHRAATDAEVNDLVGLVARTAAMCPEYAAEVGESADLALATAQRGNRDPFTSKTLDGDIGARFVVIADTAVPADEAPAQAQAASDAGSAGLGDRHASLRGRFVRSDR